MPDMSGMNLALEIRPSPQTCPASCPPAKAMALAEARRHGFEVLWKLFASENLSRFLRQAVPKGSARL